MAFLYFSSHLQITHVRVSSADEVKEQKCILFRLKYTKRVINVTSVTRHPNIRFTLEKEVDHKLPFLDVFIHNHSPGPTTTVFRKKTFTGLLTNYFSFTALSLKIGLVRTLIDRTFKINNTWSGFHNDVKYLTFILCKNLFPTHLIDKVLNQYIARAQTPSSNGDQVQSSVTVKYFKLPYVGSFSTVAQRRLRKLVKQFCFDLDIRLAFSSFKIRNMFSVKDPVTFHLRSRVVYQFTCAACNACYVGETFRHISTRIREHLGRGRISHIFHQLQSSDEYVEDSLQRVVFPF